MATDGTTGRRVNAQSLYIPEKRGGVYAETRTHLIPGDRVTPRDGVLFRKFPIERVFSDGVGRATPNPYEPIGDETHAVQEEPCAEVC